MSYIKKLLRIETKHETSTIFLHQQLVSHATGLSINTKKRINGQTDAHLQVVPQTQHWFFPGIFFQDN